MKSTEKNRDNPSAMTIPNAPASTVPRAVPIASPIVSAVAGVPYSSAKLSVQNDAAVRKNIVVKKHKHP